MMIMAHRISSLASKLVCSILYLLVCGFTDIALAAWQPSKPITFVVTGGAGGGADQMARLIQGIVAKYKLSNEPIVVVIENGGGGGGIVAGLPATKHCPRNAIASGCRQIAVGRKAC